MRYTRRSFTVIDHTRNEHSSLYCMCFYVPAGITCAYAGRPELRVEQKLHLKPDFAEILVCSKHHEGKVMVLVYVAGYALTSL